MNEVPHWDACTLEPSVFLRWIECHPGTASWVGVLVTTLALGVAIAIPFLVENRRRRVERAEKEVRAQFLFNVLAGDVWTISQRAAYLQARLVTAHAGPRANDWIDELILKVPPNLENATLAGGDISRPALGLIADVVLAAAAYNGAVENLREFHAQNSREWTATFDGLELRRQFLLRKTKVLRDTYLAHAGITGSQENRDYSAA